MRFSVDTNVLVYAAVSQTGAKHRAALEVMRRVSGLDCIITLQVLAELFRALTGKFKVAAREATATVEQWRSVMPVVAADESCLVDAMDAVAGHGLSFWDAMLWATVKHAGCGLLLTEDGQDGFALGGVVLVNPFASPRSPLLVQALR